MPFLQIMWVVNLVIPIHRTYQDIIFDEIQLIQNQLDSDHVLEDGMCHLRMNGKQYVMHGVFLLEKEKIVRHDQNLQKHYKCQLLVIAEWVIIYLFILVVVMDTIGLLLRTIVLVLFSCFLMRIKLLLILTTQHMDVT